jgi:hypothetical protein
MKHLKRAFITLLFIFFVNIVAFSQTLLIKPSISVEVSNSYLGNGKLSDSISICTTYLYDTKVVKKYKTYVTADLNDYLPSNDNVADWNCTEITEEEEALLNKQGIMACDTVIVDTKVAGWYKVSHYTVEEKRNQPNQIINSGIEKNQNRDKYKPIRTKKDLQEALKGLTKSSN